VHFFDRHLEEQFPEKLLYGGIYSSMILTTSGAVIAVLHVVAVATERDWLAIGAAIGCIVASLGLIVGIVVQFERTRRLGQIPLVCLVAALLATLAIGFVGAGTHGGVLIAAMLVLPVVAVGIFGDIVGHVVEWLFAVTVAAVTLAVQGIEHLPGVVLLFAVLFAGIELAIASIMRFLAQNLRLSEMFRNIDGLVHEGMTYGEAISTCLERVATYMPDLKAFVLVGEAEIGLTPMLTWPATWVPTIDVAALGRDAEVLEVARTGVSLARSDFAIMPVGYIEEGVVVVMMERTATSLFDTVNELPYDLVAGALSQVSVRVNSLRRLQSLSSTDPLTGLYNRRVLMDRLSLEIDHVERDASPLCVAMIDLDHFKDYNDTYGHLAGDELLRGVAATFTQRLRKQDSAARYGGEEFCLVLPDTELPDGIALLDALREAVGSLELLGRVTFSAGIAAYEPDQTMLELIGRADTALYRAKEDGRDRVVAAGGASLAPLRRPPLRP